MKIRWKTLIGAIAIPLAVGGLSALLTMSSMEKFSALNQPPLSPPGWLFPVVWSILFILMGIASYLVLNSGGSQSDITGALKLYAIQLVFNFLWSIFFFNLELYTFSFVWLVALFVMIAVMTYKFSKLSKPAALMIIPYLIWVAFAGYLNLGIAILN